MRKFLIKVNGNQYEVEVEEIREDASFVQQTSEVKQAAPEAAPAPASAPAPKPAEAKKDVPIPADALIVSAPMPGTILSINVNIGDMVKKGQVLLILEAMKMENEIVAPRDGKIVSINTSKGASVNAGDILASIA
ncbi:MAG TPA: biotin/lipoyl-binding protein [Clostridiaceae bacterium]|nr:biotin/lipoyl-binding protein [Clostridiaceae bacterium]